MAAFSKNVISMDTACNSCGDVGHAEHIATCFRCNKSYCMLNPPDVLPKNWQCEDCVLKSKGKPEKRKTILLDATEARQAATPIKRHRPLLIRDSKGINGFKRQTPSGGQSPLQIAVASTSRGKGKVPTACSSSGVLSTPANPRNIRLTTMSRETSGMPVPPASSASEAPRQGANRAGEPSVGQGVLTAQTASSESSAPEAQSRGTNRAREPSGVLTNETENNGCSSQHNEAAENRSAVPFLGNATRDGTQIAIIGHQNANPRHKPLVITGGVPLHHPVPNACWTGDFKIFDTITNASHEIQGIHAHIPSIVSLNVYDTMKRLSGEDIKVKLLRSMDIWPTLFVLEPPQLGDIGLFFFPSKEQRLKDKFTSFVNMIDKQGLAMKGRLPNAKLLIFTSSQLPPDAHGIVPEIFLWGVLRRTRPQKHTAPGQEKLLFDSPTSGIGETNDDKNHGTGSSSRSRSEGMANARASRPDIGTTIGETNHGTGSSSLSRPEGMATAKTNRPDDGKTNDNRNHAMGNSSQSRLKSMANARTNEADAPPGFSDAPPGFPEPIYRNQAQKERQGITYSPVLFKRDDTDAPPGFSKPIYRPKRD